MSLNYHLILASKSPRRQELLSKLDVDFEVRVKSIDESYPDNLPKSQIAEYLAVQKSHAFDHLKQKELLLTSDTTVLLNDMLLEKAGSDLDAKRMLESLSGKTHKVITGVCLRSHDKMVSFSESTAVSFKVLKEEEIDYYISKYKPFDKAGAYGIQEWMGMIGITKIEGDFYNVMGLPLQRLYEELKTF